MSPVKPPLDDNTRSSASATDGDNHLRGQDAVDAETSRISAWTKPNFGQGGRHQSQLDGSFGFGQRRR
jgi:hypothetical protein